MFCGVASSVVGALVHLLFSIFVCVTPSHMHSVNMLAQAYRRLPHKNWKRSSTTTGRQVVPICPPLHSLTEGSHFPGIILVCRVSTRNSRCIGFTGVDFYAVRYNLHNPIETKLSFGVSHRITGTNSNSTVVVDRRVQDLPPTYPWGSELSEYWTLDSKSGNMSFELRPPTPNPGNSLADRSRGFRSLQALN